MFPSIIHKIITNFLSRNFSHAFSDKTLRESESILQHYIERMIEKLHSTTLQPINIIEGIECALFDIIGDLVFGSSFDSVESSERHVSSLLSELHYK